jgi:ketosteroid isomerase-like protein
METYQRLNEQGEFADDLTSEKSRNAMLEAFTEDFELSEPPSLPHGGVHKGIKDWLAMHGTMRSLWEQKVWPRHVWEVPEDDLIVLYSEMEWTAHATGRTVRFPAVELLHFRDGKIARVEMFLQDTKIILDTLESSPTTASPAAR